MAANLIDLTTVGNVKSWANITTHTDDDLIQSCITAASQYVTTRTGRDVVLTGVSPGSSLNSIQQFTEVHDGNGALQLFLRNDPIISIVSVQNGPYTYQLQSAFGQPGIYIATGQRSIAFYVGPTLGQFTSPYPISYSFTKGKGNIQVVYTAGYSGTPADLEECVKKIVATNYMRRQWIDLASVNLNAGGAGSGSTSYRSWEIPPECEHVIQNYTRKNVWS